MKKQLIQDHFYIEFNTCIETKFIRVDEKFTSAPDIIQKLYEKFDVLKRYSIFHCLEVSNFEFYHLFVINESGLYRKLDSCIKFEDFIKEFENA